MHEAATESSVMNAHALLSNERRKLIVKYLSMFEEGDVVDVSPVARIIRGVELGTSDPNTVRSADYESAYNCLIQQHLPKLDEADVIDYNDDRKTIEVLPAVEQMANLAIFSEVTLR